jgi:hypothetical protein
MKHLRWLLLLLLAFAPGFAISAPPQPAPVVQGKPDVKVWVNTASGVYHCPGSKWYGKTKEGKYMTQAEAIKAGFRPAYGRYCE